MKYKLAIFDFDGTLADSFPFFWGTQNELAEKYNFKTLSVEELEVLNGEPRKMMKYVGMPLWKIPIVMSSARKMMTERIDQIPLFDGVEKMLKDLSNSGVILSLITSNSRNNVFKVLTPENMTLFLDPQFDTSLFGKGPRLKKLLRKTRIDPNRAIYIGNEVRDMESASTQNIPFGAVSWGYTKINILKKYSPAEVFTSMDEIVEKIVQ